MKLDPFEKLLRQSTSSKSEFDFEGVWSEIDDKRKKKRRRFLYFTILPIFLVVLSTSLFLRKPLPVEASSTIPQSQNIESNEDIVSNGFDLIPEERIEKSTEKTNTNENKLPFAKNQNDIHSELIYSTNDSPSNLSRENEVKYHGNNLLNTRIADSKENNSPSIHSKNSKSSRQASLLEGSDIVLITHGVKKSAVTEDMSNQDLENKDILSFQKSSLKPKKKEIPLTIFLNKTESNISYFTQSSTSQMPSIPRLEYRLIYDTFSVIEFEHSKNLSLNEIVYSPTKRNQISVAFSLGTFNDQFNENDNLSENLVRRRKLLEKTKESIGLGLRYDRMIGQSFFVTSELEYNSRVSSFKHSEVRDLFQPYVDTLFIIHRINGPIEYIQDSVQKPYQEVAQGENFLKYQSYRISMGAGIQFLQKNRIKCNARLAFSYLLINNTRGYITDFNGSFVDLGDNGYGVSGVLSSRLSLSIVKEFSQHFGAECGLWYYTDLTELNPKNSGYSHKQNAAGASMGVFRRF